MWNFQCWDFFDLEAREILAAGIGMLDSEIDSGNEAAEKFWSDGETIGLLFGWNASQSVKSAMPKGLVRKERVLVVPIVHLMSILTGRAKIYLPDDIPADSFPLRTFQDESSHAICIVVGHPSFKPIEFGFLLPQSEIKVTYPEPGVVAPEPEIPVVETEEHNEREV